MTRSQEVLFLRRVVADRCRFDTAETNQGQMYNVMLHLPLIDFVIYNNVLFQLNELDR